MIFTKAFWIDTAERTVASFGEGAVVGLGAAHFTDIGQVVSLGEAAGLAGLGVAALAFFKCIAASYVGDKGTPSLVTVTEPVGQHEVAA